MSRGLLAVVAGLVAASLGCHRVPDAPDSPAAGTFTSAHFSFQYTSIDAPNIAAIAQVMEDAFPRILADLAVAEMPQVHVTFYLDHRSLEVATEAVAGVVPAWSSGLVTAADRIHLMSPNLPAWAPYGRMISNLVHEFAHCVSMKLNPSIPNRPRWLWESVALYESGQMVDPRGLSYMTALAPPSFDQLNAIADGRVYDVGYTIAEFVVARWGQAGLRTLVAANGDTGTALATGPAEFEQQWFAFVRSRYGF